MTWFKGFHIVLNALDNLGGVPSMSRAACGIPDGFLIISDARRHVNRMCMAADIPLIESGTAGYLGQVQPLLKVRSLYVSSLLHVAKVFCVGCYRMF